MKYFRCVVFLLLILAIGSTASNADEIKGRIQAVNGAGNAIEISGVRIVAQNARIENEMDQPIPLTALVVGDYVEVDGYLNAPGQMTAMKIEKDYSGYDEIKGRAEKVDLTNREIFISGVKVKVPQGAYLEGYGDMIITLEQIPVSAYIDCKGSWTGPKEFTANKIDLD